MSAPVATGIQTADLHLAWPGLWPLLKPAYEYSPDKDDILAGLMAKRFALFGVYASSRPVAGIVAKILVRGDKQPTEKHAHLWLVGGHRLSEWSADFINKFVPWAKAEGCCAVTGNGRKGWDRIVRKHGGYRTEDVQGLPAWRLDL